MSLVRKRTTSLSRPATAVGLSTAAGKKKTKPEWDSTNSDLNQLKPSADELERRKLAHHSKNAEVVKAERQKQELLKGKKAAKSKADVNGQLALLREILFDENQLRSLILKSDATLKTVRSIFHDGDDDEGAASVHSGGGAGPKRQAKINMTLAPNVAAPLNDSSLPQPAAQRKPVQPVAASVKNLNEDAEPAPQVSETAEMDREQAEFMRNLAEYREVLESKKRLIERKRLEQEAAAAARQSQQFDAKSELESVRHLEEYLDRFESEFKEQMGVRTQPPPPLEQAPACKNAALASLSDEFNAALGELESQLSEFEERIGRPSRLGQSTSRRTTDKSSASTLTLTLIQMVSRVLGHLRDTTLDLGCEKRKQEELGKQLDIHRKLIDGLTNELLGLKEQNEKMVHEFVNQQAKLEAEVEQLKLLVRSAALLPEPARASSRATVESSGHLLGHAHFAKSLSSMSQHHQPSQSQQSSFVSTSHVGRPGSSMSAVNMTELGRGDAFSERLNAMLHGELNISLGNSNGPPSAFSKSATSLDSHYQPPAAVSSGQLFSLGKAAANAGDFREQICELGSRNAQAQQRLKQVQLEHAKAQKAAAAANAAHDASDFNESVNEAYEKLKQEKQLLKEQINLLNKQRETAKMELEVLALSSGGAKMPMKQSAAGNMVQQIKSLGKGGVVGGEHRSQTPSLSPIQPENIFSQESELKGHYNLEVTPPRDIQSRY